MCVCVCVCVCVSVRLSMLANLCPCYSCTNMCLPAHKTKRTRERERVCRPPSDKKLREDVDENDGVATDATAGGYVSENPPPTPRRLDTSGEHGLRLVAPFNPQNPERRNLVEGWRGQLVERQLFRSLKIGDLVCPVCKQKDGPRGGLDRKRSFDFASGVDLRGVDLMLRDNSHRNFIQQI